MKKAKILYIITQSNWGGAQRYVLDLAVGLQRNWETVVACGGNGELVDRLQQAGMKNRIVKNLIREINPATDWKGLRELMQIIDEEKPDIIHTNSSKAEILGNLAGNLKGCPVVFTAHGFVFNEPLSFGKKQFYIWLERLANLGTKKIICVSNFDRQSAIKNHIISKNKLSVVHNGIDWQSLDQTNQSQNEIKDTNQKKVDDEKIIIGTVANFYANKGLEYLLSAAEILQKDAAAPIEFWIIGDGQERAKLEKIIAEKKLTAVKLLGFQAQPEKFYSQFSIFVLPSLKEGFPYTILEAMAAGLPIVASRIGGIPEAVVAEGGVLVQPGKADELADMLALLINDKDLRDRMGAFNQQRVETEFSKEQMLKATVAVYEEILKNSKFRG